MNLVSIVANLKSNKTQQEAQLWLEDAIEILNLDLKDKEIIVCPPFTLLSFFNAFIKEKKLPISLGAQNVSQFDEGPYTGEENAKQIKEFAQFVLIGHSERRINFNETDQILTKKVEMSLKYDLIPIYLVQNKEIFIPNGVKMIAYEPTFAIGSGNPDTPDNANSIAFDLKTNNSDYKVLYGGSVNPENVNPFIKMENIDGVLIGGASLDGKEFIEIVKNA